MTEPTDDTPVTWGDLRRVARTLYAFQSNALMMTVMGMSNALEGSKDPVRIEAEREASQKAEQFEKELNAMLAGPDR